MGKILLVFVLFSADQISKIAVLKRLHQNETIPLINNILHITLVYNTGSAFGFFRGYNLVLACISVIAIAVIVFLLIQRKQFGSEGMSRLWRIALILILCGAAGNLVDRLRFGYVIDFIDLRVWPVFNFADSMITCGVFLLMFLLFKNKAVE